MSESRERERNRERTLKRSRMWQVVGEDGEEEEGEEGERRGRDRSVSPSESSESDSDSSEEEMRKHKKHKKSEKKSKKNKKEKKEKKKHKKDKKEKKEKKEKKDERHKSSKTAVDQNAFGKYGIIREEHYFQKQREFEAYIFEVKKLPGLFGQSKTEIMKYFRDYVEDYNTATMPHEKYYNIARWESEEYNRAKQKKKKPRKEEKTTFDDEAKVAEERRAAREKREQEEFNQTLGRMVADKDRRTDMRRQDQLKVQLQQAHRRGDTETVRRLENLLAPDEEKSGGMKHPWAK